MKLYLSVGGFVFTVKYHKDEAEFFQPLMNGIRTHYKNFITPRLGTAQSNCSITISHTNTISLNIKDPYSSVVLYREITENNYETYSHISFIQFTAIILRLVRNLLNQHAGFLLHASAINRTNKALLFLGRSGSGKSTIAQLLSSTYQRLADDNVIIRQISGRYYLYQSPLVQKVKLDKLKKPLVIEKIYFIKKDTICSEKLVKNKPYVFKKLLEHAWVEKDMLAASARAVEQFSSQFVSFYTLRFPKDTMQLEKFFAMK